MNSSDLIETFAETGMEETHAPGGWHVFVMDRKPGGKPALNEAEIRDVIAFLQTLNDGYSTTSGGPKALAR